MKTISAARAISIGSEISIPILPPGKSTLTTPALLPVRARFSASTLAPSVVAVEHGLQTLGRSAGGGVALPAFHDSQPSCSTATFARGIRAPTRRGAS